MSDLLSGLGKALGITNTPPNQVQGSPTSGPLSTSGVPSGTTILSVSTTPQPLPVGNGITIVNNSPIAVIVSSDNPPTAPNSSTVPPNGASYPVVGNAPRWISATAITSVEVIPAILNIFNPNVFATPPTIQFLESFSASSGNPGFFINPVPAGIKTLVINFEVTATVAANDLFVQGAPSQFVYYNQLPYLASNLGGGTIVYTAVIPILQIDASILVRLQGWSGSGNIFIETWGDINEYKEDILYNGITKAASGSTGGSLTLVTGPCRLLTATLEQTGAASVGSALEIGGTPVLNVFTVGAVQNVTFPPNTIVPGPTIISLNTTAGTLVGAVSYAYP
jgi:hypothetical protein